METKNISRKRGSTNSRRKRPPTLVGAQNGNENDLPQTWEHNFETKKTTHKRGSPKNLYLRSPTKFWCLKIF
jgi:hypothetical protein